MPSLPARGTLVVDSVSKEKALAATYKNCGTTPHLVNFYPTSGERQYDPCPNSRWVLEPGQTAHSCTDCDCKPAVQAGLPSPDPDHKD